MSARRLVGVEEAAEYIGVSTKSIRRWIASGNLTGYRVGPRLIKIDLNEVDERLDVIGEKDAGHCDFMDSLDALLVALWQAETERGFHHVREKVVNLVSAELKR